MRCPNPVSRSGATRPAKRQWECLSKSAGKRQGICGAGPTDRGQASPVAPHDRQRSRNHPAQSAQRVRSSSSWRFASARPEDFAAHQITSNLSRLVCGLDQPRPAWTSPSHRTRPTGRRKQCRYHPRWRVIRHEAYLSSSPICLPWLSGGAFQSTSRSSATNLRNGCRKYS